ncbi:MAG: 50S ribosomal protein L29 [Prevotellaceae bacterium]|jgi:large subunit ribosomal protein L29|nr:50S ribosomal protein L29 [Prevotellaceae bacterium]
MKNKVDLKEYNTKDLKEKLHSRKGEYLKMRLDHAVSPLENPMRLKNGRKEIARILTELRQREINGQNNEQK